MGRRSVNTTKSGKFMNPTDQARKEARKKELKKNKKQRLLVRTAVLKNKDPTQIISELDKLDEMEYNPLEAPSLAEKVLKDKRKKLKETLDRVMRLYQKEDPSYWNELKHIEADYERRRFHRIQYYEAVKQAETISVDEIPLPESAPTGTSEGDNPIANIPLPSAEPAVSILKKSVTYGPLPPPNPKFEGREAPGIPQGPLPSLSDIEGDSESEEEADDAPEKINSKPNKSVRFEPDSSSEKENETLKEMDRFMKEVEEEFKSMNEDDLLPPGTESASAKGGHPNSKMPENTPEESEGKPKSSSSVDKTKPSANIDIPLPSSIRAETAAAAATALAAASIPKSHMQHPPSSQFYPPSNMPPPGLMPPRMRYPSGPPMSMMRPPSSNPFGPNPTPPHLQPRVRSHTPRANVFSGNPQLIPPDNKVVSDSTIQAKPQIRSLSADVTRFVPVHVKSRKDAGSKQKKSEYQIGQTQAHVYYQQIGPMKPQPSKDDAYADFMEEMQGLL